MDASTPVYVYFDPTTRQRGTADARAAIPADAEVTTCSVCGCKRWVRPSDEAPYQCAISVCDNSLSAFGANSSGRTVDADD